MSDSNANPSPRKRDPDLAGAEAAMHRAAQRAQEAANSVTLKRTADQDEERRAAASGSRPPERRPGPPSQAPPPPTYVHGTASPALRSTTAVSPTATVGETHDRYSFSQAQGYEEIPGPLQLEELPRAARTQIWNLFFARLKKSMSTSNLGYGPWVGREWEDTMLAVHTRFDGLALDDWRTDFWPICEKLRRRIETDPFNKVFDLIQFVVRQPRCSPGFITEMRRTFAECRLAYTIDAGPPPTIVPAARPEEGEAILESLQTLRQAGLDGSATHLREAAACINRGDWAGSVRDSIHAVESVARQLDPKAAKTLAPALKSLQQRGALHSALENAFGALYGYTSNEQGIRHALLDRTDAQVGQDEAVFMLGACASFASYLWRKHAGRESA